MWIRGEDREFLVNMDRFAVISIEEGKSSCDIIAQTTEGSEVVLGRYGSKEVAKYELKRLLEAYEWSEKSKVSEIYLGKRDKCFIHDVLNMKEGWEE